MKRKNSIWLPVILAVLVLAANSTSLAQGKKAAEKAKPNPAYAPVTDVAGLPRASADELRSDYPGPGADRRLAGRRALGRDPL